MGEVNISGPFFSASTRASVLAGALEDAQRQVAAQASSYVHTILNQRIKHPTPYYETQITTEKRGADIVVHDRGIVYGPWLEGVGSRNRTTRFKGYAAFRTARQQVAKDVQPLVENAIDRHLGALQ